MFRREGCICYKDEKAEFSDCDFTGGIKLSALLKYTSNLAGDDYLDRNLSWEKLREKGMLFLVSRVSMRIIRRLRREELITVATYERGAKGPFCLRDYFIEGEDGEKAVAIKSAWILCDPETRRILRPEKLPNPIEPHWELEQDCDEPDKIVLPGDMEAAGGHVVAYSDTDANAHVNNGTYADIACDFLPLELMQKEITDFKIVFRREAHMGETIDISRRIEASRALVAGTVDGEGCFSFEIKWKG